MAEVGLEKDLKEIMKVIGINLGLWACLDGVFSAHWVVAHWLVHSTCAAVIAYTA